MLWFAIGAGGALGAITRHAINGWIERQAFAAAFPAGIFVVNVVGSAAIGVIAGLMSSGRLPVSPDVRAFLMIGLLGGFTTFSSFSLDTIALVRVGLLLPAVFNVVGQVTLALVAAALGYRLAS